MSYTHLTRDDRIRLGVLLRTGLSFRTCARHLGVSPPTVSVEVDQNGGGNNYNPYRADKKARLSRHSANQCHRKWNIENRETKLAVKLLELGWSPDQIAGRSRLESKIQLFSPATIYNNVNPDKALRKLLPRKHNKYRRRKDGNARKRAREEESTMKSIDVRPKHIEKRKKVGHWEGDTIIGKERTARILTHVERKTGYLLAKLLYEVSAEKIRIESVKSFRDIPDNKKETVTYDRGLEFADHELTEKEVAMQIYFAHAYHSWERGTNENTNGLVRRYFPKGTYFSKIRIEQLNEAVKRINYRPRKRLGYKMPYEKFWGVTVRIRM